MTDTLPQSQPAAAPEPTNGPFSSLANRDYRMLWYAGLFSFLSVQGQLVLRGILAWDLTESDSALGVVYLVFGASMLVATPIGGVAADRISKRTILIGCQIALFAVALTMGVLVLSDSVRFWMLPIASGVQGMAFAFFAPSRMAFTAELVGRAQLGNAISLSVLSMNGTRVFAPFIAALLAGMVAVGIGGAYLISAAISALALGFLLRTPAAAAASMAGTAPVRRGPFDEILDGLRYVRRHPEVARIVIASFFVIMFGFNYVAFMPSLVADTFGLDDVYLGVAMAVSAIGAVATSLPTAKLADGPSAHRLMVISGFVFGGAVFALAFAPSYGIALVILLAVGGSTAMFQSLSNTIALTASDDAMAGRVQSLLMLSFAGFGIAAGPLGLLAEAIGRRQAIAVMGAVAMLAMVGYSATEGRARTTDV
ncbi:MAG: MFS transporter [Acidimicrobiales bacterium]